MPPRLPRPPTPARDRLPRTIHARLGAATSAAILLLGLVAFRFHTLPLPASPGFMPAFGALSLFADLLTALLLLSQALVTPGPPHQLAQPTAVLANAYLFAAVATGAHLLAFPGIVATGPILGDQASAVWLWCVWHAGFALAVLHYSLARAGSGLARRRLYALMAAAVTSVLIATLLATVFLPFLPTILVGRDFSRLNTLGVGPTVVATNLAALALVLHRLRCRDALAIWLAVAMLAANLDVLLTLTAGGRYTVGWYAGRVLSLLVSSTVLATMLAQLVVTFRRTESLNRELEVLSLTDSLTTLANRRAFDVALQREWRRCRREGTPLSLLLIDVDLFKSYNDTRGHPAGDACLQQIAATIRGSVQRASDVTARFGGEEFAVLLPLSDAAGAARVAASIHANLMARALPHPTSPSGHVTVSIGTATSHAGEDHQAALVDLADHALYDAKQSGRNRTSHAARPVADQRHPSPVELAA